MQVNIHEAKTRLSQLVERALMGEEIVIAKAGKPLVRLTRLPSKKKRVLGAFAGEVKFLDADWDKPMTQEQVNKFFGM